MVMHPILQMKEEAFPLESRVYENLTLSFFCNETCSTISFFSFVGNLGTAKIKFVSQSLKL
jgi:hypothetical protein